MNIDPGFYAGVEWSIELTLVDADGQAVDLQGLTLRCDLYPSAGAPSQFHFLSTNTPVTPDAGYMDLTDADQGIVVLIATATQHENITKGRKLLWHLNDITEGANPSFSARGTVYIGKSGEQGSQWTVGGVIGSAAGITFSGRGPRGIQGQSMVVKDTLLNLNAAGAEYAAGTGARVYADPGGDAVNGNYTKVGALGVIGSWTRVGALLENEHFLSTLPQSVAVLVRDRLSDRPHARDFGLVSSASNDQASELQTAVDQSAGRTLILPRGTYLTSLPIVIDAPELTIQGDGGHLALTQIRGIGTAGPVIRIRDRSIRLYGINVTASDERRASGAVDGHGILYAGDDAPGQASKSRQELDDIFVNKQPGTGIVGIGPMQFVRWGIISVHECLGHGALFDDGAYLGYTNRVGTGIIVISIFNANQNAGHGLAIGSPNQTQGVFRVHVEQLELTDNAWNATTRFSDHQMYCGVIQTMTNLNSAYGDNGFADTTTGGYPRPAKLAPSGGVNYEAGAGNVVETACRYIGLSKSADIRSGSGSITINNPRILVGSNTTAQLVGFDIENGAGGTQLNVPFHSSGNVVQLVRTRSTGTRYVSENRRFRPIPGWDDGDWEIEAAPGVATISGGDLLVQADAHRIDGEGGVADDLVNILVPDTALGAAVALSGFRLKLYHIGNYIITITGTGNVKTPYGWPFPIHPNSALSLITNGVSWWIEGVHLVPELSLLSGSVAAAHTGTTAETELVSGGLLRANTMGLNGSFKLHLVGSATNISANVASGSGWEIEATISNIGLVDSQRSVRKSTVGTTGGSVVQMFPSTHAISTNFDRTLAITAELANAGDSVTLDRYSLKLAR